jgi:hypothetical protein
MRILGTLLLVFCAAVTLAVAAPSPLAQSAQLQLFGTPAPGGLTLTVRHADGSAVNASELSATVDGRSTLAARQADGSWLLRWPGGRGGRLDAVVTHDGIRELLSGALPGATAPDSGASAGSGWREHKQLLWWVLNIGVVLVAVLAVSRRMS